MRWVIDNETIAAFGIAIRRMPLHRRFRCVNQDIGKRSPSQPGQVTTPNVQRKLKAATGWCERINALEPGERSDLLWHYVLLGESLFHDWRSKGAGLADLLAFARARPLASAARQGKLSLG
jgi:hypothetical protein